ncbi:MAG TPA: hypothetical protein VEC99_02200, partial [Clostridia bacterium]|nr:hypothetical protein [Clostridia bacterium]
MTTDHSADFSMPRRKFLKLSAATVGGLSAPNFASAASSQGAPPKRSRGQRRGNGRAFNAPYSGEHLNHVAFPMGGIGAGMICLEGRGTLSHVSLRNRPDVYNEPCVFAAISLKAKKGAACVLEGPVPARKIFGP